MAYTSTYVVGDIPAIATDALGTAGAAAVSWIPLAVTGGVIYFGAKHIKKKADKLKKEARKRPKRSGCYKGWYNDNYRHSLAAKKGYKYRR